MQEELETLIPDDVNEIMLAMAKKMARAKRTTEIGTTIIKIAKEQYLSAKAQNALVDSIASEEMYLADWLDRINSMCVHQIDLIRSIVSKEKEEMRMNNFTNVQ